LKRWWLRTAKQISITTTVLHDARIANEIHIVEDGEQALAFLRHQDGFSGASRPDLVLLDLNLPKKGLVRDP